MILITIIMIMIMIIVIMIIVILTIIIITIIMTFLEVLTRMMSDIFISISMLPPPFPQHATPGCAHPCCYCLPKSQVPPSSDGLYFLHSLASASIHLMTISVIPQIIG